MGGGWNEVVSLATDLGAGIDTRATRRESAVVLADSFPDTGQTTTMLAHRADATIFGVGQPSEEEVREYWAIVDGSLKEMTGTLGFWRRQQARFSPRSLLADGRYALRLRGTKLGLGPLVRPSGQDSPGRRSVTGRVGTGPDPGRKNSTES
ncbi:hypothetical protein AHiyo4_15120 [Arthrobacter sp. Hiyo4]|nr:hypothetical protein AHiyo4_15120 [Arthrobacter sp. Hiyo4]